MPSTTLPTGRRLGALFLGYLLVVVAVITLAPFHFVEPTEFVATLYGNEEAWWLDLVLNVALFLPLGFFWHRVTGHRPVWALVWGLSAGVFLEGAQLYLAPRFTTLSDVVANGFGCWIGALSSLSLARRVHTGALVSRLWLDQPMMGLVHLLIPLIWLHGLGAADDPSRLWLLVPLGMAGALTITAVATVTSLEVGTRGRAVPIVAALGWYVVSVVPAFRVDAVQVGWGALATLAVALIGGRLWRRILSKERRLEPQVVRALLPFIVVVVTATSLDAGSMLFEGEANSRGELLRALGQISAFTILGYLLAEARGRREEAMPRVMVVPVAVAAVVCVVLALLMIEWPSVGRIIVCLTGAAYGAVLYDAQRAHIVALRARV